MIDIKLFFGIPSKYVQNFYKIKMNHIKLAIIREDKVPIDKRCAIIPSQAKEIQEKHPNINVVFQPSKVRAFTAEEYQMEGINHQEDIGDCDIMIGVKEVPIANLIADKTYFFFSHTIKKQPYNQPLLRAIVDKNIRLIDYECLVNSDGQRIIAFGRYAGIVGAYNAIWTYGKRTMLFDLKRAKDCFDLAALREEFAKVRLPPAKIILTGGGRVAKGAMEVLDGMNVKKVAPVDFLNKSYSYPVYAQLDNHDYHFRNDGNPFDLQDFYVHPENYEGDFLKYARKADILIAAAYWHPKAPVLFSKAQMREEDFNIKVIADITCDIEGSIPSTKRPSTIDEPVYDYCPEKETLENAFSSDKHINVMAIDNLPCELPRDSSRDFGRMLIDGVLPALLGDDAEKVIENATICRNGQLTQKFAYLQDYLEGK